MSSSPQEVQVYLRRLTLLLPPRARRAVWAEVEAHLHGLAHEARLGGQAEPGAWAMALLQAGPVWPAALRLAAVHTLRPLRAALLVGAALGSAAYAVQSGAHSPSQVPAVHGMPVQP